MTEIDCNDRLVWMIYVQAKDRTKPYTVRLHVVKASGETVVDTKAIDFDMFSEARRYAMREAEKKGVPRSYTAGHPQGVPIVVEGWL